MPLYFPDFTKSLDDYADACEIILRGEVDEDDAQDALEEALRDIVSQMQSGLFDGKKVNMPEIKLTNGAGDFELKAFEGAEEVGMELLDEKRGKDDTIILWVKHDGYRLEQK